MCLFLLFLEEEGLSDCQKEFKEAMKYLALVGPCGDGKNMMRVRFFFHS